MQLLTIKDIFPEILLRQCDKIKIKKAENFRPLVELYLDEINKKTGQENDVKYLCYVLEYAFNTIQKR